MESTGDWYLAQGLVVRKVGVEEVEVDGAVQQMAVLHSPDFGMSLRATDGHLEALPARSVLEDRRARLLAPVESIPRDYQARETEFAEAVRNRDVDAGILCLRNLRASGSSVTNAYEGILFKELLPLVITPIAIGLDEEPVELAELAGVQRSSRLGPLYT